MPKSLLKPKLTLEAVHIDILDLSSKLSSIDKKVSTLSTKVSGLSKRINVTNRTLNKTNETLKAHDEAIRWLLRKQLESDDRFERIENKLDGIDKALTLLPNLYELCDNVLSEVRQMRQEHAFLNVKVQNHEGRLVAIEKHF